MSVDMTACMCVSVVLLTPLTGVKKVNPPKNVEKGMSATWISKVLFLGLGHIPVLPRDPLWLPAVVRIQLKMLVSCQAVNSSDPFWI